MPPRSPLPQRNGLDASWMRTPDRNHAVETIWADMGAWLHERLVDFIDVDSYLVQGRFVYKTGEAVRGNDPYRPHTFMWFHRDLLPEKPVPGEIHIVHRDERIIVIDKPPFLSTIPRGRHVQQSVVVRLRAALNLPELSPLHRLDRVTSGLLILATEKRWRRDYQMLFQSGEIHKSYRALAAARPEIELPVTVRNHLGKQRGRMQADLIPGEPVNAESHIERESVLGNMAVYRLTPKTGRTHQLRMHMWGLGLPISGDPLYPRDLDVPIDNFSTPLQLLANEVEFIDPVDGSDRRFSSIRSLPLRAE